MQNDAKPVENYSVCDLVFKEKGKPGGFLMCKAINVFDNKYRVNIYTKRYVDGIESQCISQSYFVSYSKDKIKFLS
jgi:hypothetical protein